MDIQQQLQLLAQQAGANLRNTLRRLGHVAKAGAEGFGRMMDEPIPCPKCKTPTPLWMLLTSGAQLPAVLPKGVTRPYWCCPACIAAVKQELAVVLRDQAIAREYVRVQNHNDRAAAKGAPATLTGPEWLAIVDSYHGRCYICGAPFTDLEHLTPISQGGGTTADNCVPACSSCNSRKGKRHPDDIIRTAEAIKGARVVLAQLSLTPFVLQLANPARPEPLPEGAAMIAMLSIAGMVAENRQAPVGNEGAAESEIDQEG